MRIANNHKGAAAPSNVVRLPTAARRKVQQFQNRDTRAARKALRDAAPWPGSYEHGPMRAQRMEAERMAAILMGIEPTPAMLIVHALLAVLTDEQRHRVAEQLAGGVIAGRKAHIEALTLVQAARMNVGQQHDLYRAVDKLRGEENL